MASIGETLKKARESKKLSLELVSQSTKIHPKVLKSLEEDDFKNLPGVLYVRSFLKKYAHFLGLDSNEIIEQYLNQYSSPPLQILTLENKEKKMLEMPKIKARFVFTLLGGVLVLFSLFLMVKLSKGHKKQQIRIAEERNILRGESGSEDLAIPKGETLVLEIQAEKDVWLQLKADGKVIFQHVLHRGTGESWKAQDNFELWVGDAHSLNLSLNGRPLVGLGRGVKRGIVINRQGLQLKP